MEVPVFQLRKIRDFMFRETSVNSWLEIFALLDEADFPAEFMTDRQQRTVETREL